MAAAMALAALFGVLTAASAPAQPVDHADPQLTQKVLKLFDMSCAECHDGTTRRRDKGDFATVLDVDAMIESDYFLVPGDPEFSEVYAVMIEEDPDLRMPPPDSDAYQPTADEIAMVRRWIIDLGDGPNDPAPTDDDAGAPESAETSESETPPAVAEADGSKPDKTDAHKAEGPKEAKEPARKDGGPPPNILFARMHPLVVHFPVAVIPMAAFIALTGAAFRRYDRWLPAIRWSLWVGAIVAPVAVISGWMLADIEGFRDETVQLHRWLGVAGLAFAWVSIMGVEWAERTANPHGRRIALLILLAVAVLIGFVGHTGGELVYGKGYPFN